MVEYCHSLSAPMVQGLKRLLMAGGKANLKTLNLERNVWDNFQKLRYFNLVVRSTKDNGLRDNGVWEVTELGRNFLSGEATVPARVWTYRGEFRRVEGDLVKVSDLLPTEYQHREDYAAGAVPTVV